MKRRAGQVGTYQSGRVGPDRSREARSRLAGHGMSSQSRQAGRRRHTHKTRTLRAYGAYLDLLHAAEWMGGWMRGQLETFDVTMGGFLLLEMVYRGGAMSKGEIGGRLQCTRQNVDAIVERLEENGWVRREVVSLPPAEIRLSHINKAKRDLPRRGPRIGLVQLTPLGEKFIGFVFPKHAKVVKALMRVLDGREQETLSRLCKKLCEGDVLKFFSEMTHEDREESGE
jgi:MarR family 2-MHQ and catechol resistance regulon transcriptional repressor